MVNIKIQYQKEPKHFLLQVDKEKSILCIHRVCEMTLTLSLNKAAKRPPNILTVNSNSQEN
jgi:hypothetical protein